MPENVNLNLGIPKVDDKLYGNKKITGGRPRTREPINLQSVIRDIKARKTSPEVEEALIRKASSYPHGALPMFKKNLGQHILMVQKDGKTDP
jgi:hypothetical protein